MVESSKIKLLREKLGLSQEKLARLADISNNTIIYIEAGKQHNLTIETLEIASTNVQVRNNKINTWPQEQ